MGARLAERAITIAWLVRFRWAMLATGALVALVAAQTIHVRLPWTTLSVVGGVLAASNIAAPRLPRAGWLAPTLVVLDGLALTIVLALVGGIDSPFVLAYLALIVLGSTLFGRRGGAVATAGAAGALAVLAFVGQPIRLDHDHGPSVSVPTLPFDEAAHPAGHDHSPTTLDERAHLRRHAEGTWAAFAACALLIGYLIDRALRRRERQIDALLEASHRATQLAELGAMAAQAAHELGTPLATIAVAARELEAGVTGDLSEEASVIVAQVTRCREVLDELAQRARGEAAPAEAFDVAALVEEAARLVPEAELELDVKPEALRAFGPRRAILHVVRGLLENAHRAAPDDVILVRARADDDRTCLEVIDRGPGLDDATRQRVGLAPMAAGDSEGLGLGIFLSRALVERVGGHLALIDAPSGTTARLVLPTGRVLG